MAYALSFLRIFLSSIVTIFILTFTNQYIYNSKYKVASVNSKYNISLYNSSFCISKAKYKIIYYLSNLFLNIITIRTIQISIELLLFNLKSSIVISHDKNGCVCLAVRMSELTHILLLF